MRKFIFTLSLALLATLIPRVSQADDNVPKADILDVVFNEDGSAYDASPMDNPIQVFGKDLIETYYSESYKRIIPKLFNPWGGTGQTYYKVDYENNQTFKDALANGHTLETLVMADYTLGSLPDSECKPFTSHQSGGTGLMVSTKANGANGSNEFAFLPCTGGSYHWVKSGVRPEPGIFYHLVGVWNKEEGKAYVYVNGELKATVDAPGDFTFPTAGSNWFGIGADPSGETGNTAWNGEVALARIYDAPLTAEQIAALYKQVETGPNYGQILKNSLDSINNLNETFPEGTNPGYYTTEVLAQYKAPYDDIAKRALDAIENGTSDDEYISLRTELLNAYAAIHEHANPMSDGYYYFINAYGEFKKLQDVEMAMCINADKELSWGPFDGNPLQLFKVTKLEDGNYSIQNVASGEFIGTKDGVSALVPMTATQTVPQTFTLLHSGQWNIANTENSRSYHTQSHNSGAGTGGRIVAWQAGVGTCSAWILNPVTDQEVIDRANELGPKEIAAAKLKALIVDAKAARDLANEYTPLITNANDADESCQISSNAKEPNEGTFANLIDKKFDTYFHSTYSMSEPVDYHNLQVDMLTPQSGIFFKMQPRNSSYMDFPNDVDIYATNDETLGKDANSSNESWTKVAHFDSGFPTDINSIYTSPSITFEEPYRYFRMVVLNTVSKRTNSNTGLPYYTLSEFQLYNSTPTANSQYNTLAGMKEACDALDALVKADEEKVANKTATLADTTELLAATRAVRALYVDRDALDAEFAALLDSTKKTYSEALGSKVTLVTNATDDDKNCQLSSNAKEPSEGSFAGLIDGTTSTYFHSIYSAAGPGDGIYHNLQIDLKGNATNSFFYEFTGRNGSYCDTPNKFNIYATNDPDLGSDPNSEDSQWTLVSEVDEPTIPNSAEAHYTSPVIEMDNTYRYIRFSVIGTTSGRTNGTTGMPFFTLSEFQMYSGVDPQRVQYNYNPEVKAAADALKALIDKGETMGWHQVWQADINELRGAMNKLLESYVDTTQLVLLTSKMNAYAFNTIVDEAAIGCVKSQEALDAFEASVATARNSIDPIQPTKASVTKAIEDINTAYQTLMENMNKVEPNKWYYIVSKSNLAYCANKAMFLNSTNVGTDISFGQYDSETGESTYTEDAYAMWRLVPIEGTEYYGIQNMCTSHFFGPILGKGNTYKLLLQTQPSPYRIDYIGKGQLQMVSINDANPEGYQLHAQNDGSIIVPWPTGLDGASCWTFLPVDEESVAGILIKQNSIRIETLPFDIPAGATSLMSLNEGINTYAVKDLKVDEVSNTTTLELTVQEDVKAGVPFIMTYGDYTQYNEETSLYDHFFFQIPANVDSTEHEANGLIGTLKGLTIQKSGFGYIENDGLKVTTGEAVSIIGQRGYIDPAKVKTGEGSTDLVLTLEGGLINGINVIDAAKASDKVNVYSIDGKLLKKNVKATDARKNLKKGIYIIGKKKVAIK